jgi:hypothetical protein
MKKISTVVAKQSKKFRDQKLTIGLDLAPVTHFRSKRISLVLVVFSTKVGSHVNRNCWNQFEDRSKKNLSGDCSAGATTANASNSGQKGVEMPAGFEDHLVCSDPL